MKYFDEEMGMCHIEPWKIVRLKKNKEWLCVCVCLYMSFACERCASCVWSHCNSVGDGHDVSDSDSAPQIQLWCWHCAPYKCSYYYYFVLAIGVRKSFVDFIPAIVTRTVYLQGLRDVTEAVTVLSEPSVVQRLRFSPAGTNMMTMMMKYYICLCLGGTVRLSTELTDPRSTKSD